MTKPDIVHSDPEILDGTPVSVGTRVPVGLFEYLEAGRRNGDLLRHMLVERFDTFLTVDQTLEFQQNLRASVIGVVVVIARNNRVSELRLLVPEIL